MKRNICFCALLFLASCNSFRTGDLQPLAKMTFNHVKPYPLYVASYEPVAFVKSSADVLPEGFVADPANLVHDYLNNRFEAVGSQGKLRVSIRDVSVQHEVLHSDNKVGAMLGLGKRDHYVVRVKLVLQAYGGVDYEYREMVLTAHRNIYISEFISLVERENAQMLALDNLVDDLDISIRKALQDEFSLL